MYEKVYIGHTNCFPDQVDDEMIDRWERFYRNRIPEGYKLRREDFYLPGNFSIGGSFGIYIIHLDAC